MGLKLLRQVGAVPKLVGHRGACAVAPENTLASFARALEGGADIVELDVRRSADGAIVVIHDEAVDRTTDGSGLVAELTLAQLKRLDAGAWFGKGYAGERIPTLHEVLDWARGQIGLMIELKYTPFGGYEPSLVPEVLALIAEHRMEDQVAFISYQPRALAQVKSLEAHYAVGPLVPRDRVLRAFVRLAKVFPFLEALRPVRRVQLRPLVYTQRWQCDVVAPNIDVTTRVLVEAAHLAGFPVSCGGIEWDYPAAIAMGLDTISANDPGKVRERYLRREG